MNLGKKKCLIVGDIMLDHYISGKCNRVSPEAPVPIVDVFSEKYILGGAANLANNIISLGLEATLISVIGDDNPGARLIKLVKKNKIKSVILQSKNRKTTIKTRVLVDGHHIVRLDNESKESLTTEDERKIENLLMSEIINHDIILLSDYNKGTLTNGLVKKIIKVAISKKIKIFVDPKSKNFSKYKGVSLIKPNLNEAVIASGINIKDENSLKAAAVKIKKIVNCDSVVITMSERGAYLYTNRQHFLIPAISKEVIDVTGAGDTFLAALTCATLNKIDLFEACKFANYASALAVIKSGNACVTEKEILNLMNNE